MGRTAKAIFPTSLYALRALLSGLNEACRGYGRYVFGPAGGSRDHALGMGNGRVMPLGTGLGRDI